ncbi:MAG: fibronectin type III-like domain-contianing protein, partial [Flavobacteriaceae bacterium]|nr:fibronectin type III-like domain-contianing protein [Flavobacteriaceae bacterium]
FGIINPSGKLPYTYPKYSGNFLTYYHKKTDIRDVDWGFEGFYPQYEFGFGLSYANFKYSNLKISQDTLHINEDLIVSIDVQNLGTRAGKETVQVFLKDEIATVSPDVKRLVRFDKISLNPSETKTIEFKINSSELKTFGINNNWIFEEGYFEIQIGVNPNELLKSKFYLKL